MIDQDGRLRCHNGTEYEVLAYFQAHAGEWLKKAQEDSPSNINVIKQRNGYVLHIIQQLAQVEIALDVGCGTGDLVLNLAKRGIHAVGVDFAPEMIHLATEKANKEKSGRSQFVCSSIFDFDMSKPTYDCISANGFIEYISYKQLLKFISMTFQALKGGGSVIMGSRNRLFNLFSQNDFTKQEIELGTVSRLFRECIAIVNHVSFRQLLELESPPPSREEGTQVKTGIDVSVRLQYTPLQLMKLLHNAGFEIRDICPIHIHGVIPQFKDSHPQVHVAISSLLQTYAQGYLELIPQASSFMIHATKGS